MAQFKVSGNMKVKTLKEEFRANYGAELRVYYKNHFADEEATLASIREGDVKGGEFECGDHDLVGTFENFMKELYGIQVQVASPDNKKLVDDNMKLCDLVNIKAVKERGAREKVTFIFNGNEYTIKGRFCQAVVRYYADQHPEAKLEDLQKVFDINKKVPMVASREQALAILDYEGKAGGDFFLGEGDDIDVRGGKVFVWKYFPKTYFDPFMAKVKELGYEFEVVGESEATQSETANTEKKKKTVTITINSPKVGNLYRFFDCSDEKYVDLFDDDADAEEVIDALWDNDAEPFAEDVIVYLSDDEEVNVRVEDEDGEELFDGEVSPVNEFCADPRQLDTSLLPKDVKKIIDEDIQNELNDWESEDFEEYENEHRDEDGQVDWSEFECSSISPGIVTDIIMSRKCNACAGKLIFTDTSTIYGASYDGVIELDEDEEFDIDKLELYITDHDVTTCWEDCVSPMVKYGNKFYLFDIGAWDRDEAEGEWKDLRDE